MSADNEIGVCRFNDGWRMAQTWASDWCPGEDEQTRNAFLSLQFKDSEVFATEDEADAAADALFDKIEADGGYVEYGMYTVEGCHAFLPAEEAERILAGMRPKA